MVPPHASALLGRPPVLALRTHALAHITIGPGAQGVVGSSMRLAVDDTLAESGVEESVTHDRCTCAMEPADVAAFAVIVGIGSVGDEGRICQARPEMLSWAVLLRDGQLTRTDIAQSGLLKRCSLPYVDTQQPGVAVVVDLLVSPLPEPSC